MVQFFELNFRPESPVDSRKVIKWCKKLGISVLGTDNEILAPKPHNEIEGITIYRRAFIDEQDKRNTKQQLAQTRFENMLVSVHCKNANLTKWALTDNRVDIISFDSQSFGHLLDRKAAKMTLNNNKIIEINFHDLIFNRNKISIMRNMQRAIHWIKKKNCRFLISSGANNLYGLRNPRDLCGLATLFNIPYQEALKAMSIIAQEIVTKNKDKLAYMIEEGVWTFQEDQNDQSE